MDQRFADRERDAGHLWMVFLRVWTDSGYGEIDSGASLAYTGFGRRAGDDVFEKV